MSQASEKRRPSPFLFAAVVGEAEGEDAFVIRWTLKHFRMAQGANGVVVAGASVLLHAGDRRLHACVAQVLANMFSYYSSVGVTTAGFPTTDTLTCPKRPGGKSLLNNF